MNTHDSAHTRGVTTTSSKPKLNNLPPAVITIIAHVRAAADTSSRRFWFLSLCETCLQSTSNTQADYRTQTHALGSGNRRRQVRDLAFGSCVPDIEGMRVIEEGVGGGDQAGILDVVL